MVNKTLIFLIGILVLVLLGGAGLYFMYTKTSQQTSTDEVVKLDKTVNELNTKDLDDNSLNDIEKQSTQDNANNPTTANTSINLDADLKNLDALGTQTNSDYSDTDLNDLN